MKTALLLVLIVAVAAAQEPENVANTTNAPKPTTTTPKPTTTTTTPKPTTTTPKPTTTTPKPTTTTTTPKPTTTTTTPKPTTTTPKPTTTTPKPTTTTTPKPNTTTTTPKPTTSTAAPTGTPGTPPTPKPESAELYFLEFEKNKSVCILLDFAAQFVIPYTNVENKSVSAHLNIVNATVDKTNSYCQKNKTDNQKITLNWGKNMISFMFVNVDKKIYPSSIELQYYTDKVNFPGHPQQDKTMTVSAANVTNLSASASRSFQCKAETDVKMSDKVVMSVTNAQIQAFREEKDKKFSLPEVCSADDKTSNIVPIAVGCALAALVLIVLVAYCIGRRRSRQKGYQSV